MFGTKSQIWHILRWVHMLRLGVWDKTGLIDKLWSFQGLPQERAGVNGLLRHKGDFQGSALRGVI